MKKEPDPQELSDDETAAPTPEDEQDSDAWKGRTGEGAHSVMKHLQSEEHHPLKRREH